MNESITNWLSRVRNDTFCWWCGKPFDAFARCREIHHIERRGWGPKERVDHPCNLFLTCKRCHMTELAASNSESHARQLAHKLVHNPEDFDLVEWLRIRDPELRAPERVTVRDLSEHLTLKGR